MSTLKLRLFLALTALAYGIFLLSAVGVALALRDGYQPLRERAGALYAGLFERMGDPLQRDHLDWFRQTFIESGFAGGDIWLVDADGKILATSAHPSRGLRIPWERLPHPAQAEQSAMDQQPSAATRVANIFRIKPRLLVRRLNGTPPRYLVIEFSPRGFLVQAFRRFIFVLVFWVLLIAAATATVFFFAYFRRKSRAATVVLERLAAGELEARFRISTVDEAGQLMLTFNRMADRISELVLKLRQTERARTELLQEISHDLRTPLTSSVAAIETLHQHYQRLDEAERKACISILDNELSYLRQLVEDLFFLAEVDEPRYQCDMVDLDLRELVVQVVSRRRESTSAGPYGKLHWDLRLDTGEVRFLGNRGLLGRMVRNALDNALKHAKDMIRVELSFDRQNEVVLSIRDDGPGVTEAKIRSFGVRRTSQPDSGALASGQPLGLGSVIMRTVAELHHIDVRLANWKDEPDEVSRGARLDFRFPLISRPNASIAKTG